MLMYVLKAEHIYAIKRLHLELIGILIAAFLIHAITYVEVGLAICFAVISLL